MSTAKPMASSDAAGGGSATASVSLQTADVSASVLQEALQRIHSLTNQSLREVQRDTHAPGSGHSFKEFAAYIAAANNSLVARPEPNKDWTRPLNEYFISSSHNTYLVGHQLYGASTTAGYINVLRRGCRCIEIDVWDGDDGEPEVFHGYTLTKAVPFRDVCEAIAKHAFAEGEGEVGEAPVIISLESHATHPQQYRMVEIMKEVWGDMLVQGIEPEDVKALPTPADLRRKILVKTKYQAKPPEQPPIAATNRRSLSSSSSSSSSSDSELEALSRTANKQKPRKSKVVRALAALGVYCSSYHFPSDTPQPFLSHPTSRVPNHVYSFSEKAFRSHAAAVDTAAAILEHNKHYLMRVYPAGMRISSSNADPTSFWRAGVQLVALNWQKCDEGMMLNEGMFAAEQGFVLKPSAYRPASPSTTTLAIVPATAPSATVAVDLTFTILAAANLPLPGSDKKEKGFEPYVKIEIYGSPAGKVLKNRTPARRGCAPSWGPSGHTVEFRGIAGVVERIAFVRIRILDEEFGHDDLAAWACVRLDRLQVGYRIVRLFDDRGVMSSGLLLLKVGKIVY